MRPELGLRTMALPSLHSAYSMLLVPFLWRLVSWWTRPRLAIPPAMAFALVSDGDAGRHTQFEPVLVD